MNQKFKSIDEKIFSRDYKNALTECNSLIEGCSTNDKAVLLRIRTDIYSCMGEYNNAYKDRLDIIDNLKPLVEDYYFAAHFLLNLSRYEEAIPLLDQGIVLSSDLEETYYLKELYFLKAFAFTKLRIFEKVIGLLEYVEDDMKIWIDRPASPYTKQEIFKIIESHQ